MLYLYIMEATSCKRLLYSVGSRARSSSFLRSDDLQKCQTKSQYVRWIDDLYNYSLALQGVKLG